MARKRSKKSVDYSRGMGSKRCRNCVHYLGKGVCERVEGLIDPEFWCELFRRS
jgi:hypothetical protein